MNDAATVAEEITSLYHEKLLYSMGALYQVGESVRFNPLALYPDPGKLHLLAGLLASKIKVTVPVTVVAPEGPSDKLGQAMALYLSTILNKDARAVFATKMASGHFYFLPTFKDYVTDRLVVVVKDTFEHGDGLGRVVEAVTQAGGTVGVVSCLINTIEVVDAETFFAETRFVSLVNL
jgi:orotate phosphoribosyltransferase